MKFQDLYLPIETHAGLIALIVFLLAFIFILMQVLPASKKRTFDETARLVFNDEKE